MLALPPARDDGFERALRVLAWALRRVVERAGECGVTPDQVQEAVSAQVGSVIQVTVSGRPEEGV